MGSSRSLPDWLGAESLRPLWEAVAERLERQSFEPVGRVVLADVDRAGRHALAALLGRPVVSDRVRVDLADLDALLRARSGVGGLRTVAEAALQRQLRDRRAVRTARAVARERPYQAAREWLDTHPHVAAQSWPDGWLAGLRRSGALTKIADAPRVVVAALEVTAECVSGRAADIARAELAARLTGNAHALDDGAPLTQLVLRTLACAASIDVPAGVAARRALWERYGVSADTVFSTCLTLGLRPVADGVRERRLRQAADAGDPVHLTPWDVRRTALAMVPGSHVLVCENPRVLESFAERRGGETAVVCVAGEPNLVTLDVLTTLRSGGAHLLYHGDFDWPGIAIANRLMATAGVQPWRMSVADYRSAVRADGPPLHGPPVEPRWDPALGAAMEETGVAVHEESVLDVLVDWQMDR